MRSVSRSRRASKLAALLILLVLPIFIGAPFCSDSGTDPDPLPDPPSRTTPKELLENWFENAYTQQDSTNYDKMLDAQFQFTFTEVDAESLQASGGLPAGVNFWGKTSDLRSTGRMFRSDDVGDITLDLLASPDVASSDATCPECREVEADVLLRVTTDPQSTDPLILAVDSKQVFLVKKDPADTTQWVIVKQTDVPRS